MGGSHMAKANAWLLMARRLGPAHGSKAKKLRSRIQLKFTLKCSGLVVPPPASSLNSTHLLASNHRHIQLSVAMPHINLSATSLIMQNKPNKVRQVLRCTGMSALFIFLSAAWNIVNFG